MPTEIDTLKELSSEDIELVFKTIDIPICPALVSEVMFEAQKDVPDIRKVAKGIAADVGMSALAIKLANSPLFCANSPVHDVKKAVDRLGIRNVLCVVVTSALKTALGGETSPFLERFWLKASNIAIAAGAVARRQYGISPDAAYIYALFHNAAIPVLLKRYPEYEHTLTRADNGEISLIDAEMEFFPCTHPIAGSLLVKSWGLPVVVHKAIRFHHEKDLYELPDSTLPGGATSLIAVTQVAEYLCGEREFVDGLDVSKYSFEKACQYLGLTEEDLPDVEEAINAAIASH